MYAYIHMFVCVFIYIHMYICTHMYIYTYLYMCVYIYVYICLHIYIYTCVHTSIHLCIHTHIYGYICIHAANSYLKPYLSTGVVEALVLRVPDIFAAVKTGHDLTSVSAMYDYMGARLVLTIAGAVVLAGWPALPWGQLGPGAQPASLDALVVCAVDLAQLMLVMDEIFNLHDESPIGFLSGGKMRGAVECAFATLIMYYGECCVAGEMHQVQVSVHTWANCTCTYSI